MSLKRNGQLALTLCTFFGVIVTHVTETQIQTVTAETDGAADFAGEVVTDGSSTVRTVATSFFTTVATSHNYIFHRGATYAAHTAH